MAGRKEKKTNINKHSCGLLKTVGVVQQTETGQ